MLACNVEVSRLQFSKLACSLCQFRDLYERCYQMRRRELHWTIEKLPRPRLLEQILLLKMMAVNSAALCTVSFALPRWIRTQGFFIGTRAAFFSDDRVLRKRPHDSGMSLKSLASIAT